MTRQVGNFDCSFCSPIVLLSSFNHHDNLPSLRRSPSLSLSLSLSLSTLSHNCPSKTQRSIYTKDHQNDRPNNQRRTSRRRNKPPIKNQIPLNLKLLLNNLLNSPIPTIPLNPPIRQSISLRNFPPSLPPRYNPRHNNKFNPIHRTPTVSNLANSILHNITLTIPLPRILHNSPIQHIASLHLLIPPLLKRMGLQRRSWFRDTRMSNHIMVIPKPPA